MQEDVSLIKVNHLDNKKAVEMAISWVLLLGLSITLAILVGIWLKDQSKSIGEGIAQDTLYRERCASTNIVGSVECSDQTLGICSTTTQNCRRNSDCPLNNEVCSGFIPGSISEINLKNSGSFTLNKIRCNQVDFTLTPPLTPGQNIQINTGCFPPSAPKVLISPVIKIDNKEYVCGEKNLNLDCAYP